jgi:hypothetical protein
VQQITMRAVHLKRVEAEPLGALCGCHEGIDDPLQPLGIERQRRRLFRLVRHCRRPFGKPAAFGNRDQLSAIPRPLTGSLAAGMGKLHRDRDLRMLAHRGDDRLQGRFVGVAVETKAARRDAADGLDRGRLDAEHRSPRQRQRVDMGKMPVGGRAIDRGILAHRRHHDAVGQLQVAQLDRGKQGTHAGIPASEEDGRLLCSETPASPQPTATATLPLRFDAGRLDELEIGGGFTHDQIVHVLGAEWQRLHPKLFQAGLHRRIGQHLLARGM